MEGYEKRGYLKEECQVFYLSDITTHDFKYHYHEFDKVILFLSGEVTYMIEGKSYQLEPYDIVLVSRNDIHRLKIEKDKTYERIVLYLAPEFLEFYKKKDNDLTSCFRKAKAERSYVLRVGSGIMGGSSTVNKRGETMKRLYRVADELRANLEASMYAQDLYRKLLVLEFMVHLNRIALEPEQRYFSKSVFNEKIIDIIEYLNQNLIKPISIEELSINFYMSKYHMMRTFKKETGYTIQNYVNHKRLLMAKDLIQRGNPVTQTSYECGFQDYSTFSRAFKSKFGCSPTELKKEGAQFFCTPY